MTAMQHRFNSEKLNNSFLICAVLLLCSCATYTEKTQKIKSEFTAGHYKQALLELRESPLSKKNNKLLLNLEKALIYKSLRNFKKSKYYFIAADKLADKLYTESISKTALSFVVNDSVVDYSGEDYELVAIHTQLALLFIAQNNFNAARVEAKKINNKIYELNSRYKKNKNQYSEDGFARYLSAIIFEKKNQLSDAIIDYKNSLRAFEGSYKKFTTQRTPKQLISALFSLYKKVNRSQDLVKLKKKYPRIIKLANNVSNNTGELIILHEIGRITSKKSKEFILPVGKQIIRASFPYIAPSYNYYAKTGVYVNNKFTAAEEFQNTSKIALLTLEDKKARVIAKNMARLITKAALAEQVRQKGGEIAGLLANLYNAVSETADTRSWMLLPKFYAVSRVKLRTGKQNIKIFHNGKLSGFKTVIIKKGDIHFLHVDN